MNEIFKKEVQRRVEDKSYIISKKDFNDFEHGNRVSAGHYLIKKGWTTIKTGKSQIKIYLRPGYDINVYLEALREAGTICITG